MYRRCGHRRSRDRVTYFMRFATTEIIGITKLISYVSRRAEGAKASRPAGAGQAVEAAWDVAGRPRENS